MKTCPKCGNVIHNDNARFCKECGTDLYGKNDGGIWLGDPQKDQTPSTRPKTKSGTPIANIGIIVVAVIALFSIFLFAFYGSNVTSEKTKSETEVVSKPQETTPITATSKQVRKGTQREAIQTPTNKVIATPSLDTEQTEDSQKKKLTTALAKGDYEQVQLLANEGYTPAYVPLAKYYLNNNEYDDADRYARKAKAAGQSGAQTIIKTLENLGYYD